MLMWLSSEVIRVIKTENVISDKKKSYFKDLQKVRKSRIKKTLSWCVIDILSLLQNY